jgi:membrane protein DedA with SNARE-associated domain
MQIPSLILDHAYLGIFLLTILESACVPIPSELTLMPAGALCGAAFASQYGNGHQPLSLVTVIVVAIVGSIVGSYIAYVVGRTGGRAVVDRYGKYILLSHADLDRSEAWFTKRGSMAVLIGRCIPGIRTVISLPAGVAEMKPVPFGIFSTIGIAIWVTALSVLGYNLGDQYEKYIKGFSGVTYLVVAVLVIVIAVFLYHRYKAIKAERTDGRGKHIKR